MMSDGEARTSTSKTAATLTTTAEADSPWGGHSRALDNIVTTHELDVEVDSDEVEEEEKEEDGGTEFEVWGNDEGAKSTSSPPRYWKEGKLICEQTNLLSSGRRRNRLCRLCCRRIDEGIGNYSGETRRCEIATEEETEEDRRYKLGRFTDALKSYADFLVSIVKDELSDVGDDGDDGADDGRYQSSQFFCCRRCCCHSRLVQMALLPLLLSSGQTATNTAQRQRQMITAQRVQRRIAQVHRKGVRE